MTSSWCRSPSSASPSRTCPASPPSASCAPSESCASSVARSLFRFLPPHLPPPFPLSLILHPKPPWRGVRAVQAREARQKQRKRERKREGGEGLQGRESLERGRGGGEIGAGTWSESEHSPFFLSVHISAQLTQQYTRSLLSLSRAQAAWSRCAVSSTPSPPPSSRCRLPPPSPPLSPLSSFPRSPSHPRSSPPSHQPPASPSPSARLERFGAAPTTPTARATMRRRSSCGREATAQSPARRAIRSRPVREGEGQWSFPRPSCVGWRGRFHEWRLRELVKMERRHSMARECHEWYPPLPPTRVHGVAIHRLREVACVCLCVCGRAGVQRVPHHAPRHLDIRGASLLLPPSLIA